MTDHWPEHIASIMGTKNVLTVALDLIGGIRGARDMTLSDFCEWLLVVEWYIDEWRPSECPFDMAVLQLLTTTRDLAKEYELKHSLEL